MSSLSGFSRRPRAVFTAAFASILAAGTTAHGAVIISDTFTAADFTPLPGRAPDTIDAPGSTYLANGGNAFQNQIVGNRAQLSVDEGAAIATGVATPTVYTVSDLFNDGNIGGADQNDRGEGLGFFSSVASGSNGFHGDANFTGITVSPAGLVSLISVTPSQAITVYATYTDPGYSSSVDHTLSYSANTTSGLISGVTLDGALIPLSGSAGLFTPADTAYAVFTASANALGESATYDNFVVASAVPEPASVGLLALAGITTLARRRKLR